MRPAPAMAHTRRDDDQGVNHADRAEGAGQPRGAGGIRRRHRRGAGGGRATGWRPLGPDHRHRQRRGPRSRRHGQRHRRRPRHLQLHDAEWQHRLPSHLAIAFSSASVDRIRLYKETEYGPHDLTIQYTTDTGGLTERTWQTVTGLVNGFEGTELLDATAVNANGTVEGDFHSSAADGFASLSFDPVTATGLRISFVATSPNVHYLVHELQVWGDVAPGSITVVHDAHPDDAQDFGFTTTGGLTPATFTLDDDEDGTLSDQQTFTDLAPGPYAISRTPVSGWAGDVTCDTGETTDGTTATIDLSAGEDVTCTFTGEPRGSITVVEDTVADGVQPFAYTTTGGLTPSSFSLDDYGDDAFPDRQVFADLPLGTYSVTQATVAGFTTVLDCDTGESIVGTTATISLTVGEAVTCTATNTARRPDGQVKTSAQAAYAGNDVYADHLRAFADPEPVGAPRPDGQLPGANRQRRGCVRLVPDPRHRGQRGVTVRYRRGPTDVTNAVVAGTYVLGPTAPGSTTPVLTVRVTAGAGAPRGLRTLRVTSTSVALPAVKDVITAKATVTA